MTQPIESKKPGLLSVITSMIVWGCVLGAIGFVFGFLGPVELNPSANQGPLLGILFTGPAAAVIGLVFGLIIGLIRLDFRANRLCLFVASLIVAGATLYLSLPESRYKGFVIDAEIRSCLDPEDLVPERIKWWKPKMAAPWRTLDWDWENELDRIVDAETGVVLNLYVFRKQKFYEQQKPWNKGEICASGWENVNKEENYFARFGGEACTDYTTGNRQLWFPKWETAGVSPPNILPTFLGLYVLRDIPLEYQRLISD